MCVRLYTTLSLIFLTPMVHAWSPGPATPAPLTNLTVDVTNRNDVISFYQHVFKASENYASAINWTGNHDTCNQGTPPQAFIDLMQRRVNYYRAMADVSANITMNSTSTVVTESDPYSAPSTTTKAAAAQRSALILSRTNTLTHTPNNGYLCYNSAGANGSFFGNIALGLYGPPALEAYMREDANNANAGHRRWILFSRATSFATGDIPNVSGYPASNSLYVRQRGNEMIDSNSNLSHGHHRDICLGVILRNIGPSAIQQPISASPLYPLQKMARHNRSHRSTARKDSVTIASSGAWMDNPKAVLMRPTVSPFPTF